MVLHADISLRTPPQRPTDPARVQAGPRTAAFVAEPQARRGAWTAVHQEELADLEPPPPRGPASTRPTTPSEGPAAPRSPPETVGDSTEAHQVGSTGGRGVTGALFGRRGRRRGSGAAGFGAAPLRALWAGAAAVPQVRGRVGSALAVVRSGFDGRRSGGPRVCRGSFDRGMAGGRRGWAWATGLSRGSYAGGLGRRDRVRLAGGAAAPRGRGRGRRGGAAQPGKGVRPVRFGGIHRLHRGGPPRREPSP